MRGYVRRKVHQIGAGLLHRARYQMKARCRWRGGIQVQLRRGESSLAWARFRYKGAALCRAALTIASALSRLARENCRCPRLQPIALLHPCFDIKPLRWLGWYHPCRCSRRITCEGMHVVCDCVVVFSEEQPFISIYGTYLSLV